MQIKTATTIDEQIAVTAVALFETFRWISREFVLKYILLYFYLIFPYFRINFARKVYYVILWS